MLIGIRRPEGGMEGMHRDPEARAEKEWDVPVAVPVTVGSTGHSHGVLHHSQAVSSQPNSAHLTAEHLPQGGGRGRRRGGTGCQGRHLSDIGESRDAFESPYAD